MPVPVPGRMIEALRRSTALVRAGAGPRAGCGSAVALTEETLITNAHVLQPGRIVVESWDGKSAVATVLRVDSVRDLALLSAPGLGAPAAQLGDSDAVQPGTPVVAVGNPLGFTGAVSSGTVHAIGAAGLSNNPAGSMRWISADVRLAPGNSGGPLADLRGLVIGLNTMVVRGGLALAIPSRAIQSFLARKQQGALGVTLRPVPLGEHQIGMLILELTPGGAADRASLLPGDILAGINGRQFRFLDDLQIALGAVREPLLQMEFRRAGEQKSRHVAVQLAREPVTSAA